MTNTKQAVSKTFHRWTAEDDRRLLDEVRKNKAALDTVGQPGGITRDLFWGQIPGRIGVLVTPMACAMRYRTLTSDTQWAKDRRKEKPAAKKAEPQPVTTADLEVITGDLEEVKERAVRTEERAARTEVMMARILQELGVAAPA